MIKDKHHGLGNSMQGFIISYYWLTILFFYSKCVFFIHCNLDNKIG